MKTRNVVLSLAVSALINLRPSFASEYQDIKKKKISISKSDLLSKGLEFYPVKLNKGKEREGIPFEGKRIRLINTKPIVSFEDFKFDTVKEDMVGISISVSEREGKILKKMSRRYAGADLGVFYNGNLLSVMKMKGDNFDNGIVFSMDSASQFEKVLEELSLS